MMRWFLILLVLFLFPVQGNGVVFGQIDSDLLLPQVDADLLLPETEEAEETDALDDCLTRTDVTYVSQRGRFLPRRGAACSTAACLTAQTVAVKTYALDDFPEEKAVIPAKQTVTHAEKQAPMVQAPMVQAPLVQATAKVVTYQSVGVVSFRPVRGLFARARERRQARAEGRALRDVRRQGILFVRGC